MKNLNIYNKKSILKAQKYPRPFIGFFIKLDIITPKLMENNEYLTHAVLNPTTKIIGENAFHGDISLQTVTGNPEIISDEAFSFCSNGRDIIKGMSISLSFSTKIRKIKSF